MSQNRSVSPGYINILLTLRHLFHLTLEPGVSVDCGASNMTVSLEKKTFPFFDAARLHLRYSSCRATQNATHLLISTPLNGCGTQINETQDALIFWNEIKADLVIIDYVITRTHDIKLPFYCSYSRKKMLSLSFKPQHLHFGTEGIWNFLALVFINLT